MCVRYVSTAPQNIGISYSSDPFHIVSKSFAILSNGKPLTSNTLRASCSFKVAKSFTAPPDTIPKRYKQFSVEAESWRFCDNCYNFLFIFQDLLSKSIVTDLEVFVINPVGITNSKSFLVAVQVQAVSSLLIGCGLLFWTGFLARVVTVARETRFTRRRM